MQARILYEIWSDPIMVSDFIDIRTDYLLYLSNMEEGKEENKRILGSKHPHYPGKRLQDW